MMQEYTTVDDAQMAAQEKNSKSQIAVIDRLMDDIALMYDMKDKISLDDIERIQADNKANDA